MASVLELILKARNEASAELVKARMQVLQFTSAVQTVAPAASSALQPLSAISAAAGGLGPVGAGAAAAALSLTAMAVAAKSAFDAVSALASSAEQIGNLGQRAGLSAEQVQTLSLAAKELGIGTADDLIPSLRELNDLIAKNDPRLGMLGVTAKNSWEAFLQFADGIRSIQDPAERSAVVMALLGARNEKLIPLLDMGSAGLRQLGEEGLRAGAILSDSAVKGLQDFDDHLDELNRTIEGVRNAFKLGLLPVFEGAIEQFRSMGDEAEAIGLELLGLAAIMEQLKDRNFSGALAIAKAYRTAIEDVRKGLHRLKDEGEAATRPEPDVAGILQKTKKPTQGFEEALARAMAEVARLDDAMNSLTPAVRTFFESFDLGDRVGAMKTFVDEIVRLGFAKDKLDGVRVALEAIKDASGEVRGLVPEGLQPRGGRPAVPDLPLPSTVPTPPPPRTFEQFGLDEARENLRKFTEDALALGTILEDAFHGLASALGSGLQGIFESFLLGTQKFADAVLDLIKSLVREIIAQFARLLAIKIISALFVPTTAISPGTGFSDVPLPSPAFAPTGAGSFGTTGGAGSASFAQARPITVNVNTSVNSLTTREAFDQIHSPGGIINEAVRRALEVAAA